jgi:type IV secretion system protein VirD4
MTARKFASAVLSTLTMIAIFRLAGNADWWLSPFASSEKTRVWLVEIAPVIPHLMATITGTSIILLHRGGQTIRHAAAGVLLASMIALLIAAWDAVIAGGAQPGAAQGETSFSPYVPAGAMISPLIDLLACGFSARIALKGNAAFARREPKRITGKRALHGDARWMSLEEARLLFSSAGGIVIGEGYRVDRDAVAGQTFRPADRSTWGRGGRTPLLCFDGAFGSTHGLVFAGSGGFKTSSVTIPTALKWGGSLVLLDPSGEVAPMVKAHRERQGRHVRLLDPKTPYMGFNALDWIGRFGSTKEEDIAAVASWIMSETGRASAARDDFFRASALQLLTAMIADVCLSGHTPPPQQTLRQVRSNLSEPEPKLKARLQEIHDHSDSSFVKENVAAFVNMTAETFSGVYANAIRETHWLSYPNYAALVSGSAFETGEIAMGTTDVFLNIDLKTLETHAGLARVIIGSLLNAVYNRNGMMEGRVLFLIDEAARLGFMRILETARDAGRKYGITLLMLYQSIGQLRETYGGRDASSKWFESASWISFAAINDPETADYISRRCGMTTVETDAVSHNVQARGGSRTRSKQLAARPLIQPHEVLLMRSDEQIVFTSGHPPLRCGRAIWFRRSDMSASIARKPPDRALE